MGCCPPGEQGHLNCYVVCNVVFWLNLDPKPGLLIPPYRVQTLLVFLEALFEKPRAYTEGPP